MATLTSGNKIKLDNGSIVSPQQGAWYDGQRYMDNNLLGVGEYERGKLTSFDTIGQTNQGNIDYIKDRLPASSLQPPSQNIPFQSSDTQVGSLMSSSLSSNVSRARKKIESSLADRMAENDQRRQGLEKIESETLGKIDNLTTPFAEDLENKERERLYVNQNFEDNQRLTEELEGLLQEGNDLIAQQKGVTGLSSIRNPRIQQTMENVAARAGVIQAVMSARNSQIQQAYNLIDRSIGAINQDRQSRLSYYDTVLSLNNQKLLSLDNESKDIANQQVDLLKNDLANAQETSNYIKQLMLSPSTAALMGDAGVSLNDSVESINAKISEAQYQSEIRDYGNAFASDGATPVTSPDGIPQNRLRSVVDSKGITHYYKLPIQETKLSYTGNTQADAFLGATSPMASDFLTNQSSFAQQQPIPSGEIGQSVDSGTYGELESIFLDVLKYSE